MDDSLQRNADLRNIAQEIAAVYGGSTGMRAVLLCGSVSRGWADRWSDIELTVCWETMPSLDVRIELATSVGAEGRRVYPANPDPRTHEEEFTLHGEKIDLAHMEIAGVAAILAEVTVQCDTSLRKHALVADLRDAVALTGEEILQDWQHQAPP